MDCFKPMLNLVWKFTEIGDNHRLKSTANQLRTDVDAVLDIPYINDGAREHLLDVYFPRNSNNRKLPLIINIHGGGWLYGYKEINVPYNYELASNGFCVISLNYRLAGKNDVKIHNQIQDVFSALSFIEKNIQDFPADLNNCFLTGDSAGGQFACLSSAINLNPKMQKIFEVTPNNLKFKAVCVNSPVIDLLSLNPLLNVNLKILLGDTPKKSPFYKFMRFSYVATNKLPPFYITTSSGDFVHSQSVKLHKMLDDLKVENKLRDWQGRYQGKKLQHVFCVIKPRIFPSQFVIKETCEFFNSYM